MSYFDEQEIRKRVIRRVRRRFLFVVHTLASLFVGFAIVYYIHSQYLGGNPFAANWGVGSEYYKMDIFLTCAIIGALLLVHFLWFLYRELVDNALGQEMRFVHQNKVYQNEVAAGKLKREEYAHLTDDGEIVVPEDLDSDDLADPTKQWQRN